MCVHLLVKLSVMSDVPRFRGFHQTVVPLDLDLHPTSHHIDEV